MNSQKKDSDKSIGNTNLRAHGWVSRGISKFPGHGMTALY
jgi:hypothetical protein